MCFVVLLLLFFIAPYVYSMEEDITKKSEEYKAIRAQANPLLAMKFNKFDKKWNRLQNKVAVKKNNKISKKISKLAIWGIKNLLPEELAYHIAYYRLKQDISCMLCPNNIIKLIFSSCFRGKIIPDFIGSEQPYNRDSISQNHEKLQGGNIRLENGNYYRPRFQLECGPLTGKVIFSDHGKETYFYLDGDKERKLDRLFFDGPNEKYSALVVGTVKRDNTLISSVIFAKLTDKFFFYRTRKMPTIFACALHGTRDICAIADNQSVHIFELKEYKKKFEFRNYIPLFRKKKNKENKWKFENHIEISSSHPFKKICFITQDTLLGLTQDGQLITIALPKGRFESRGKITNKQCIAKQHFFINKGGIRISPDIKDFAVNTASPHHIIMLATMKDEQTAEHKKLVLYVSLNNPGRFACIEDDAQDVKNLFFSGDKMGFLEHSDQGRQMNIQEVCFIPYQQLQLLYSYLFLRKERT